MALTTNYSWDKPTVSGDVGAWGTKANTIFDSIDSEVKNRQNEIAVALADIIELANQPRCPGLGGAVIGTPPGSTQGVKFTGVATLDMSQAATNAAVDDTVYLRLNVCPGMRITGFTSRGIAPANTTLQVDLLQIEPSTGVGTVVSAGHSHSASAATLTTSGLTHDVVANKDYVLRVRFHRDISTNNNAQLIYTQLTVTRP